jgi:hypothetical protein
MDNLIYFLGGIAITLLIATLFHIRAGWGLRKEASELRHLNILLLRSFQQQGIDYAKDEKGNPIGLVVKFRANIQAKTKTSQPELTIE